MAGTDDDAQLRAARRRTVMIVAALVVLWLLSVAGIVGGILHAVAGGSVRLGPAHGLVGAIIIVGSGVASAVLGLRFVRLIRSWGSAPDATAADRVRVVRAIRAEAKVEDADAPLADAVATRMAANRQRGLVMLSVVGLFVGLAVLLPDPVLVSVLAVVSLVAVAGSTWVCRSAAPGVRYLASRRAAG